MQRPLLNAALLAAALLALPAAREAFADTATCAVRLRNQATGPAKQSALESVWGAAAPVRARPLLAGGHVAALLDAAAFGASVRGDTHPFGEWYVLEFASVAARDRALDALSTHPELDVAEPIRTLFIPEEPRHDGISAPAEAVVPWNVLHVRAPEALARVQPDSSIIVAVIDSGADLLHSGLRHALWQNDDDFGNNSTADDAFDQDGDGFVEEWEKWDDDDNGFVDDLWGYDFTDAPGRGGVGDALVRDPLPADEIGHGTHVAGIIAADGELQGVAPFVQLMVLRAAFSRVFGSAALETDDAAAAIVYAVDNGARILNLSFGDTQDSRLIREAIDYAVAHDVIVVAAAGNGSSDATHYPSSHPAVIGVGASNRNDQRASFSNFGAGVELVAPGQEAEFPGAGILSLGLGGQTRERRGTSMAVPHVVGVAAIVMSRSDRPDARRTRALLASAARRGGAGDWSADLGYGVVDALAAATTDDDVVVQVLSPALPYRFGRFSLVGTILSGDAPRWGVEVRPLAGSWIPLIGGQSRQVVVDTLVSVPLQDPNEGEWEYRIAVELGDGRRRETRGAFFVDTSEPVVEGVAVNTAWRGSQPRWVVSTTTDDPVQVSVYDASTGATLMSHPGLNRFTFLEAAARPAATATWNLVLENVSGVQTQMQVAAPGRLEAWPEDARVVALGGVSSFAPEPVVGLAPGGATVVWGRLHGDSQRLMQAWSVQNDRLVPVYDTGIDARPVAYADINGDGAPDLLYHGTTSGPARTNVQWLVTRTVDSFPDSVVGGVSVSRALGLFNLDDDPAYETLLSSDDKLFVYDDAVGRAPPLIQTLSNPSETSFNIFGSTAAVDDIDRDGRLEIVCGDADGAIAVFERSDSGAYQTDHVLASGGTYAYAFATLPEGGFVVGRQRTQDVSGDGFETVLYDFIHYGTNVAAQRVRSFVTRVNVLDAAVASFQSTTSGSHYVVIASENQLYLAVGDAEPREHVTTVRGDDGRLPAIADFDADGWLEMVVPDALGGQLYRFVEDVRGPHDLHSESLSETTVILRWQADATVHSRVQRRRDEVYETLGETMATSWVDSTLQPFETVHYRVQAIVGGESRGTTREIEVTSQPRLQLRSAQVTSSSGLRLRFSAVLHNDTLIPGRLRIRDAELIEHRVVSLAVSERGQALDVAVDGELLCGTVHVEVDSLRDDQGGLLDPPVSTVQVSRTCATAAFHVVRVDAVPGSPTALRVEFSRAPGAAAAEIGTYELRWRGTLVPLQSVRPVDATRFDVVLAPEEQLVGYGVAYEITISSSLRAAADGAELADAGTVYRAYVEGQGAAKVFAYPNPARLADDEIVFAEAADDTRIQIFSLEGELVRALTAARGGGLRWDLRNRDGGIVSSGVYVFVARDARGSTRGQIAVLR